MEGTDVPCWAAARPPEPYSREKGPARSHSAPFSTPQIHIIPSLAVSKSTLLLFALAQLKVLSWNSALADTPDQKNIGKLSKLFDKLIGKLLSTLKLNLSHHELYFLLCQLPETSGAQNFLHTLSSTPPLHIVSLRQTPGVSMVGSDTIV